MFGNNETKKVTAKPKDKFAEEINQPVEKLPAAQLEVEAIPAPENRLEMLNDDFNLEGFFKHMAENEGQEVTGNYLKLSDFKIGEKNLFIYTGATTIEVDGNKLDAVQLIAENRQRYVTAAAVVVSACRKIETTPCGLCIIVDGKTRGTKGEYYNARVFTY